MNDQRMIGSEVDVCFGSVNRTAKGKVDTGATTSSIHAVNINVNRKNNTVSFSCPLISDRTITMDMDGAQEVHQAGNGGEMRAVVKLDIEIDGVPMPGMMFNLNDRSNMDSPILIGQNILKAGNFIIDVNKDADVTMGAETQGGDDMHTKLESVDKDAAVMDAIKVLAESNISVNDLIKYLRTAAVSNIENQ